MKVRVAEYTLGVLLTRLMKTIHVELPNKAIHLVVAEEERKDDLLKLGDVLDDEVLASGAPVDGLGMLFRLN